MKKLIAFILTIKNSIIKYYRESLEVENRPYVYFRLIVLLSVVFLVIAHWYMTDVKVKFRVGYPAPLNYYAKVETNYYDRDATQKLRDEAELRIVKVMVRGGDANSKLQEKIKLIDNDALNEVFSPELVKVIRNKSKKEQRKLSAVTIDLLKNLSLEDSEETAQSRAIWKALDANKHLTRSEKNIVFQMCEGLIVSTYEADPNLLENLRDNVSQQIPLISRHFEPGDLLVAKGTIITRDLKHILAFNGFRETKFPYTLLIITFLVVYIWTFFPILLEKKLEINLPMSKWLYIATMLAIHWGIELIACRTVLYRCFSLVGLTSFLFLTLQPELSYNIVLGSATISLLLFFEYDSCLLAIISATLGYIILSRSIPFVRRSVIWFRVATFSLFVSAIYMLIFLPLSAMRPTFELIVAPVISALFWAIWVVAGLPLVETIFGIITPFKLLELSSMSQPIFKRLQLEAPGTYNHTLAVANLSESVAEQLGLNALLVKVGALFHDIGKLKCPAYFVENQPRDNNVHDDLSPVMSAKILISHVKNGYEMAKELKLPSEVCNLIIQHHGTTFLSYFYEKAQALNIEVEKKDFIYPGPKPQSKEAALLMIIDSVEAALKGDTSGLETKDDLYNFIKKIIASKIEAYQFDRVDFTLKDLNTICQLLADNYVSINYSRHVKSISELVSDKILKNEVSNAKNVVNATKAAEDTEDVADEL
ncbi:MAG: HDIG domain-containing protein [Synergistaceae bacterium]|nr:HDIG domain-containing protein [Synergistaceae bacterium]